MEMIKQGLSRGELGFLLYSIHHGSSLTLWDLLRYHFARIISIWIGSGLVHIVRHIGFLIYVAVAALYL